jgi:hypothetical protein
MGVDGKEGMIHWTGQCCPPPVQVLPQDLGHSSLVYHWSGDHSHSGGGSATGLAHAPPLPVGWPYQAGQQLTIF